MNDTASEKLDERISKFIPYDQFQELLLPKNVQDYVPENHVARTVSSIIDFIDISDIVMSYDYEGAPPYHPLKDNNIISDYLVRIQTHTK